MPGGSHAVYPGTFDPFTVGHRDVVERVRRLFDRVTVLVAVNPEKVPSVALEQRVVAVRGLLGAGWGDVSVVGWVGLTAEFCREAGAGVIVRGVRHRVDMEQECRLAAMNESLGVSTLLVPARPELSGVSSTVVRGAAV